jgi:hypothetical protein
MVGRAFKRRKAFNIPFISRTYELLASYFADGLYSAENIESTLKEVFGTDKSILDCSYATSTGTRIGLPVATVSNHPSYRIFTNYNGVRARDEDEGKCFREAEKRILTFVKIMPLSSRKMGSEKYRFGKCKSDRLCLLTV